MWKTVQVAVQGRGHIRENIPCQDKTFVLRESFETISVALADGAGSAKKSEIGAECAVEAVCKIFNDNFDRYFACEESLEVAEEIVETLREVLRLVAEDEECDIKDLASTLLAVSVQDDRFISFHIGDGVIGCLDDEGLQVLSTPDNGEFLNETTFLTSSNAISSVRMEKGSRDVISGFVLMSDGTATGLYNRRENKLLPVIARLIEGAKILPTEEAEEELAKSFENSLQNITADDCSMILLVEADENLESSEEFSGYEIYAEDFYDEI